MKRYAIGDYFVLRGVSDLEMAAKKLEDDGYRVYANEGAAAQDRAKYTVNAFCMAHGLALMGIERGGHVIFGAPSILEGSYVHRYFGSVKPKERPLIG